MEENAEWPSKSVAQGGLFHLPKVKYSKDTHDLIKLLMEEARLTMMQRKKMNYFLRNGESLPPPPDEKPRSSEKESLFALEIKRRAWVPRRRTYDSIADSGAFEVPRYIPIPDSRESIEKTKRHLQESMSGIKISSATGERRKRERKEPKITQLSPQDQIDELKDEINERADWLAEMESIGEGKQYRKMIETQIADKLREIRLIEKRVAKGKAGTNRELQIEEKSSG